MDFFQISLVEKRGGIVEVRPDFIVGRSKDLMVRGQSFYAIWDEAKGLWSTDEYAVTSLVDEELYRHAEKLKAEGVQAVVKPLSSNNNGGWNSFKKFCKNLSDNYHQLDLKLSFANSEIKKSDYVSKRLPYSLALGKYEAWDEIVGTLYTPEERAKIEWTIGAVISGDSKKIEKFMVFYGAAGTGKSTIMKIIQKLFEGYYTTFEAKALVGNNNSFATEQFKSNPLVAIQHDGDLSKIEDNSKLNSIISHEEMNMNEKFKSPYTSRVNAFLYMGTNKPVKITDAKSGIIRRLIDVKPTGELIAADHYFALMAQIDFELGAIAQHCLDVYRDMGKNYYNSYRPRDMMLQTDVFFNFVEAYFDVFKSQDGTTLKQAFTLYKEWFVDAELEYKMSLIKFREELKNYFDEFHERIMVDGTQLRSYYRVFTAQPFKAPVEPPTKPPSYSLVMEETESLLDEDLSAFPAQYTNPAGNPLQYWTDEERMIDGELKKPRAEQVCSTVLSDLDTSKLHFVKVPENHIVIDFDVKVDGKKSLEANLVEASRWPHTYAEVSKSEAGVHLHYIYDGEVSDLANVYSEGIEIKVYTGGASLRRKLTKCNNVAVSTISGGLPFKEKKPMLEQKTLQSEKGLREMINKNLRKEVHPGTKPSVDFIKKILDDAYNSGMPYDVTDMRSKIMAFANNSTNQALLCLKTVMQMKFASEVSAEETEAPTVQPKDDRLVIFDCEVYPNLFVLCWKYEDGTSVVRMINPKPAEVEAMFQFKLVGFNNRKYDNHILWARMKGASNEELYQLSKRLIANDHNAAFGQAYNLSYADVYDFSSIKQGLKKFQIQLGLPHVEMDISWDEPVPEELWTKVVDYCCNDVNSTEAVLKDRKQDFLARKILAELSGLSVNSTTRKHAEKIIFGDDKTPQGKFVYTNLADVFPGYEFNEYSKLEKSTYKGEVVGEGGYVYAEPGIYEDVALLDIASMHPTSIEELELFGPYTEKFSALKRARLAIKHAMTAWSKADKCTDGNERQGYINQAYEHHREAIQLLPGTIITKENAKGLSDALKLVINSIYGYTSATFDNPFRDPRNIDNIVAKRGALFMIDLKNAVQDLGYTVAHIKTDSIKIPNATQDVIDFVMEYGRQYGYDFEHEGTYKKMCLVNDAVYIAQTEEPTLTGIETKWTATGAQFQHPYVFKTLFSQEPINFRDLCEAKEVKQGVMYLKFDGSARPIGRVTDTDAETKIITSPDGQVNDSNGERADHIGRTGLFLPVVEGAGGGRLVRVKDDKEYAVTGTKGYLWVESEMLKTLNGDALERMPFEGINDATEGTGSIADIVDMAYFTQLAEDAYQAVEKFGSFEEFVK